MRPTRLSTTAFIGMSAILAASGCLKRHEIIQVRQDRTVSIALDYSGPKDAFDGPDALPSPDRGWVVERSIRKEVNDEKHVLTAMADFAPGATLPRTYGDGSDAYLHFPTDVRREERPDAVYYHFHRTYAPRKYAMTQYWNERFIDDDIKLLGEKDKASLTQDERIRLIRAFANVESHQQLEVIRAAVDAALPATSREAWLASRRALLDVYEGFDFEGLADSIKDLDEDAAGDAIVKAGEAVPQNAENAFIAELSAHAKLPRGDVDRLGAAIELETLRRRVTESTRSHSFRIDVALPGEVIGHNGDKIEEGRIVWEFDGRAFCDRPFELIATSRLTSAE